MKPSKRDKFYRRAPRWFAALFLGSLVFDFHLIAQVVMPGYHSIFAPYAKVRPEEEPELTSQKTSSITLTSLASSISQLFGPRTFTEKEAPTVSIDWARDRWFVEASCTNDLAAASIKTWDYLSAFENVAAATFVNWRGEYCSVIGPYYTKEEADQRRLLLIEIGAVLNNSSTTKGDGYIAGRQLDQNGQPYEKYENKFQMPLDGDLN